MATTAITKPEVNKPAKPVPTITQQIITRMKNATLKSQMLEADLDQIIQSATRMKAVAVAIKQD